jgi:hypothetical protein
MDQSFDAALFGGSSIIGTAKRIEKRADQRKKPMHANFCESAKVKLP